MLSQATVLCLGKWCSSHFVANKQICLSFLWAYSDKMIRYNRKFSFWIPDDQEITIVRSCFCHWRMKPIYHPWVHFPPELGSCPEPGLLVLHSHQGKLQAVKSRQAQKPGTQVLPTELVVQQQFGSSTKNVRAVKGVYRRGPTYVPGEGGGCLYPQDARRHGPGRMHLCLTYSLYS